MKQGLGKDFVRKGHVCDVALGIHKASAMKKEAIDHFLSHDFLLPNGLEIVVEFVGQKVVAM